MIHIEDQYVKYTNALSIRIAHVLTRVVICLFLFCREGCSVIYLQLNYSAGKTCSTTIRCHNILN